MADRIGVINKGEIILVEEKAELMRKLGRKELRLYLSRNLDAVPTSLAAYNLTLAAGGAELVYTYDAAQSDHIEITALLQAIDRAGVTYKDLATRQSSLEEIFVSLVKKP